VERFPQYRFIGVLTMPRIARVMIADPAHHVTQHGNGRQFLAEGETEPELYALRKSTWTGRPRGTADFTRALEEHTHRRLTVSKPGRPRKAPVIEFDPVQAGNL